MDSPVAAPLDPAPTARDRRFNPYRSPRSTEARRVISGVLNELQNFEDYGAFRKRKRRETDQSAFEATVSALVCDLIHRELTDPGSWLAISLSKANPKRGSRYQSPALGKTLPTILMRLSSPELAFVEVVKGQRGYFGNGRQTTIRAGVSLVRRIAEAALSSEDLGIDDTGEVIILKRAREGYWDSGDRIEYPDTPVTRRYRDEVQRINRWLDAADISFDGAVAPERDVDEADRHLRRYFNNGSFEEGGRLFGGFWLGLKKRERREGITIAGDRVLTLDYGQMGPRVLYGLAKAIPPEQDAYLIPGLENHRAGAKIVFNSLLSAAKPIERFPKGTRDLFPRYTSVRHVIEQIAAVHHPVSHLFCTGVGLKVMFIESSILVDALLRLMEKEIVALPIHDALVVSKDQCATATDLMLEVFYRATGVRGKVEVDEG